MKLIMFVVLLAIFPRAWAEATVDCGVNYAAGAPGSAVSTSQNIIVQRDTPVGTVIGTSTFPGLPSPFWNGWSKCTYYYTMHYLGGVSTSLTDVYKTNLEGVGIKLESTTVTFGKIPYTNPAHSITYQGVNNALGMYTPTLSFIKTGNITSGTLSSGLIGRATTATGDIGGSFYMASGVNITQVQCSILSRTMVFNIGDVSAASFGSAIGFIPAGGQNTENLGLNCDAGANINVMLQGTQNPDVSTTSVLALTGQGNADVAKGVGVQLLYNGTPLDLNNRIVLKQSAGGQETFPLTARYYQTKTSVSTGKANASATLDLTYQ